eukprot:m.47280 g.47280  ORF g.47280 m.47280 type:complete len:665 (+) comp47531_c0_seq3:54-2048(+)
MSAQLPDAQQSKRNALLDADHTTERKQDQIVEHAAPGLILVQVPVQDSASPAAEAPVTVSRLPSSGLLDIPAAHSVRPDLVSSPPPPSTIAFASRASLIPDSSRVSFLDASAVRFSQDDSESHRITGATLYLPRAFEEGASDSTTFEIDDDESSSSDPIHSAGPLRAAHLATRPSQLMVFKHEPRQPHITQNEGSVCREIDRVAQLFAAWGDEHKNLLLRRLFPLMNVPQTHLLSCQLQQVGLHHGCPPNCQDLVHWLPRELVLKIFGYLDFQSLARASGVSRHWQSLAATPSLWKALALGHPFRMSDKGELQQLDECSRIENDVKIVDWKWVVSERTRLQRNWTRGRCSVRTFAGHAEGVSCIQFDATKIASGSTDATIKVWSLKTNAPWSVMTLRGHSGAVRCLSMNGNQVVSGSHDATIKIWDLTFAASWSKGSCRSTITGHSDSVRCLQVDETKIVSGSYDCSLRVWDIKTGQCLAVMRGHRAAVLSLYFDEDRVVSAGMDMEIRVWDFEGACRMTLSGHQSGISSVQFDARFNVIFSGAFDGELRFWDLNTGELLETIDWIHSEGHRQAIRFVPFGSLSLCIEQKYSLRLISRNLQTNAHRIITASDDKTMKVWDIQTRRRLLTIKCHDDGVTCLSFNDRYIVSGSFDETVRLLDFGAC